MVASLDGGTTVHGRSGGLGNAADEHLFALLRDMADVILVGAGTVRAEHYGGVRLTEERVARRLRWGLPATPPPIAVVAARGLDPLSPLFTDTVTSPIVVTTPVGTQQVFPGVQVITSNDGRIDLAAALQALRRSGFRHVHCEGGPNLLAALVARDLLDELCLTISPMLLGTGSAPMVPPARRAGALVAGRCARCRGSPVHPVPLARGVGSGATGKAAAAAGEHRGTRKTVSPMSPDPGHRPPARTRAARVVALVATVALLTACTIGPSQRPGLATSGTGPPPPPTTSSSGVPLGPGGPGRRVRPDPLVGVQ